MFELSPNLDKRRIYSQNYLQDSFRALRVYNDANWAN